MKYLLLPPPSLSPRTLAAREVFVRESFDLGREELLEGCHLNYISHYVNHSMDWTKVKTWVDWEWVSTSSSQKWVIGFG